MWCADRVDYPRRWCQTCGWGWGHRCSYRVEPNTLGRGLIMYLCMYLYLCVCIYIYMHICMCVCVYIYIYIYIYMHTHTYTYMYMAEIWWLCPCPIDSCRSTPDSASTQVPHTWVLYRHVRSFSGRVSTRSACELLRRLHSSWSWSIATQLMCRSSARCSCTMTARRSGSINLWVAILGCGFSQLSYWHCKCHTATACTSCDCASGTTGRALGVTLHALGATMLAICASVHTTGNSAGIRFDCVTASLRPSRWRAVYLDTGMSHLNIVCVNNCTAYLNT